MVITWHRAREYSSGAVKIFITLIQFGSFFILSQAAGESHSGYFWQLTDLHWDQQYQTDGDPSSMCHTNEEWKLAATQSDTPLEYMSAGQYGTYSCDAPWDLIEFSIKGMANNSAYPDFIIWTGDNTPHTKDKTKEKEPDWPVVFSSLKNVSHTIRHNFPNTTLIPVLGNHDVFPGDLYPSEAESFYRAYLTEGGWDKLLPSSAQESFRMCGFYTMDVKSKVKVIVLNTNLYNTPNSLTRGVDDPCGQLRWFEQQLQLAESRHIKVLVAAHIPPGFFERWIGPSFYNPGQNDRYIQLIHDYGHVILTHVYGHTHTDSFRIFANDPSQVKSVAFISPSVTPWLHQGGVNPSLRLYSYGSSGIKDYWQYFFNLTGVEQQPFPTPQWELLYQATKAYGIPDLSNDNMLAVYSEMLRDPSIFEKYYFYNTVGHLFQECDAICIRDHICTISHLSQDDMTACQEGQHVLFHRDSSLSLRFAAISHKANMLRRPSFVVFSFLSGLAVIFAAVGAALFIKAIRASRRVPSYQVLPTSCPRNASYISINADEA